MKTLIDWLAFLLLGLPAVVASMAWRFLRKGWELGDLLFEMWFEEM